MPLSVRDGNMYEFITHTWNTIKGECLHDCSYCYMKAWGELSETRLDETEFKTDMESDNFIFVGSGIDLFAGNIPKEWIERTLNHCHDANNTLFGATNKYFFQSKNPKRILDFIEHPVFEHSVVCTTIETNRFYKEYMGYAPKIEYRVAAMEEITSKGIETYVTIEPIMDFDLDELVELIRKCKPTQVNIGKNSKEEIIKLPHPKLEKAKQLIIELRKFTKVEIKENLKRRK